MTADDTEVVTLAGLRRLVLHARDGLKASPYRSLGSLGAAEVQAYAAHQLALHVLTLVADCLPGESLTADEAAEIRSETGRVRQDLEVARRDLETVRAELREVDEDRDGWLMQYTDLEVALQRALGLDEDAEHTLAEYETVLAEKLGGTATPDAEPDVIDDGEDPL